MDLETENDKGAFWCNIIRDIHNLHRKSFPILAKKPLNGTWSNIANVEIELARWNISLESILNCQIGSGEKIMFWKGNWVWLRSSHIQVPLSLLPWYEKNLFIMCYIALDMKKASTGPGGDLRTSSAFLDDQFHQTYSLT